MKGVSTIEDVARRAGVAISTVSHVVNGTRFVSEPTRIAVERAIAATGYIPNSLARSLARSRTNTICLALSATSNPCFMDLEYAIAAECTPRKWMTLLSDTKEDPEVEEKSVRQLHERRVDGIILAIAMGKSIVFTVGWIPAQTATVRQSCALLNCMFPGQALTSYYPLLKYG